MKMSEHLKLITYSVWLIFRILNVKIRGTYHCPLQDVSFGINFSDFDLYLFTEVNFVITTDRDCSGIYSRSRKKPFFERCPIGSLLDSLQHLLLTTAMKCADSDVTKRCAMSAFGQHASTTLPDLK